MERKGRVGCTPFLGHSQGSGIVMLRSWLKVATWAAGDRYPIAVGTPLLNLEQQYGPAVGPLLKPGIMACEWNAVVDQLLIG